MVQGSGSRGNFARFFWGFAFLTLDLCPGSVCVDTKYLRRNGTPAPDSRSGSKDSAPLNGGTLSQQKEKREEEEKKGQKIKVKRRLVPRQ